MSSEGHHPLLRTHPGGGWSATVTVEGKTYHHEADYPPAALYNLAIELADDLAECKRTTTAVARFIEASCPPKEEE
jgi:hypothetical protein